jgi:hypothetical protein
VRITRRDSLNGTAVGAAAGLLVVDELGIDTDAMQANSADDFALAIRPL